MTDKHRFYNEKGEMLFEVDTTSPLVTEMAKMNRLLDDALYALQYAADMTKPEDMQGCECPICTTIKKIEDALK